jgi:hypothetical protein
MPIASWIFQHLHLSTEMSIPITRPGGGSWSIVQDNKMVKKSTRQTNVVLKSPRAPHVAANHFCSDLSTMVLPASSPLQQPAATSAPPTTHDDTSQHNVCTCFPFASETMKKLVKLLMGTFLSSRQYTIPSLMNVRYSTIRMNASPN